MSPIPDNSQAPTPPTPAPPKTLQGPPPAPALNTTTAPQVTAPRLPQLSGATGAPPIVPPRLPQLSGITGAPPIAPPRTPQFGGVTAAPPITAPRTASLPHSQVDALAFGSSIQTHPHPELSGISHRHHIPVSPRISDKDEVKDHVYASKIDRGRASIMSNRADTVYEDGKDSRVPLKAGTLVGQYLIVSLMGEGGFGLTYRATRQSDNKMVVLKEHMPAGVAVRDKDGIFVTTTTTDSEEYFTSTLDEFRDEISTLVALEHPNIVRIEDFFEANGTAYYVMPLVHGSQMEIPKLAELDSAKRAREARRIKQQLMSLLDALVYLDQNNVVHRDLKPENILVTPEGQPVILDFGSARQIRPGKEYSNMYTPAFCAPEQCAPSTDKKWGNLPFGPWTDMYSLAACMYYRITRMLPPKAETRIFAYPNDPYRPLAKRKDLQEIYGEVFLSSVDRALELEPGARWQHAQDWRNFLTKGVRQDSTFRLRDSIPYFVAVFFAGLSSVLFALYLYKGRELETVSRASANFVTKLLTDVSLNISDLPGTAPLHNRFCKYLNDYISAVEPSYRHDSQLMEGLILGHLNNGINYAEQDNLALANKTFETAADEARQLIQITGNDVRHRFLLARIQLQHASNMYDQAGDAEAEKLIAKAIDLLKGICKERPESPDYASTLVQAMLLDAAIKSKHGNAPMLEETVAEVDKIINATLKLYPRHVETLHQMAENLHLRASLARDGGNLDKAEQLFKEEALIYRQLLDRNPYKLSFRLKQAHVTHNLAELYARRSLEDNAQTRQNKERAKELFREHISLCLELQKLDAGRPAFVYEECTSITDFLRFLLLDGQTHLAESYANKLKRKAEFLINLTPDDVNFCCMHAMAWRAIGAVHRRSESTLYLAGEELAKSREIMEGTMAKATRHILMLIPYIQVLEESAEYAMQTGDNESAVRWLNKAMEKIHVLREKYPHDVTYPIIENNLRKKLEQARQAAIPA